MNAKKTETNKRAVLTLQYERRWEERLVNVHEMSILATKVRYSKSPNKSEWVLSVTLGIPIALHTFALRYENNDDPSLPKN